MSLWLKPCLLILACSFGAAPTLRMKEGCNEIGVWLLMNGVQILTNIASSVTVGT